MILVGFFVVSVARTISDSRVWWSNEMNIKINDAHTHEEMWEKGSFEGDARIPVCGWLAGGLKTICTIGLWGSFNSNHVKGKVPPWSVT